MFCEMCGNLLENDNCSKCGFIKYHNPIPVAVALVPILYNDNFIGFLGVRRGIEPKRGEIALPGGFQEIETIHEAMCREVMEECNLTVKVDFNHSPLVLSSSPVPDKLLVFLPTLPLNYEDIDWSFQNEETLGLVLIDKKRDLAFPTHTKALSHYFDLFKKN